MDKLPVVTLPRKEIEIAGTTISYRSLSRSEALKVTTGFGEDHVDEAETFILACGIDISEVEAKQWRDTTDPITVGLIVDAIIVLTGLGTSTDPK